MDFKENTKLLLKEGVFQIVVAAIEVLNQIGHGFHEKPHGMHWSSDSTFAKFRFSNKNLLNCFTKLSGSVSLFLI